jgi:hypothetical protein
VQLFHVIEDGAAILRLKGGVYRQTKIYRRGAEVFVGLGGGFVRLLKGGGTTKPDVTCLEVEGPGVVLKDGHPKFEAEGA